MKPSGYLLLAKAMAALGAGLVCACHGTDGTGPRSAEFRGFAAAAPGSPSQGFAARGLRGPDDATVVGARLLPETLGEARSWGTEPGGGQRAIVGGVRVVSSALDGGLVASTDRFPTSPSSVVSLPPRLGGGFLFAAGTRVWRSSTWLGDAIPIVATTQPVEEVVVGLDRVYVRFATSLAAVDPRTGASLDLGPLPAAPHLGPLAALDAWRAAAVADLRGMLVTADAGASWQRVLLPFDPQEVALLGQSFAVMAPHTGEWWRVGTDGQSEPLAVAPRVGPTSIPPPPRADPVMRIFGPHPLVAAVESGWPLLDATAVVARSGALARVRLSDGVVVEVVFDAFPLRLARCHPLSLASARHPAAFGFVCGESEGETRLFSWDPARSGLNEIRRFDDPREVLAFGNGALGVRGPCRGREAERDAPVATWCVMTPQGEWSELRIRGGNTDTARLVLLSDGRGVVVRPPTAGDLSTATLTLLDRIDGERRVDLPIRVPAIRADVARALRFGVWMDGFEERRPGVVGGWVDGAGSVVGIEIEINGDARIGEYIRDAGSPVVSGRWGFGWTASRRGFETIDGGMTWTKGIALPDPIADPLAAGQRVCGPIGCLMAGWLRVGWGPRVLAPAPEPAPLRPSRSAYARTLQLECEPASPAGAVFPPFSRKAAPPVPSGYSGVTADALSLADTSHRGAVAARLYAWGPTAGDWSALGRWEIRWDWPWGLRTNAMAASGRTPWPTADAAQRSLGAPTTWTFVSADDADHALLVARRPSGTPSVEVFALENGRPPLEVVTFDAAPLADFDAAIRIAGRWYLATPQRGAERKAAVVWSLDGPVAREIARVPRTGSQGRSTVRLARRTDGRALGLAVEGQPDIHQPASTWVVGVDLSTGATADPVPLQLLDPADRPIALCTGDDSGWELDMPYPGDVHVRVGDQWDSSLRAALVRFTLSRERACVAGAVGWVDGFGANAAGAPPRAAGSAGFDPATRAISASLYFSARESVVEQAASRTEGVTRFAVRCWLR